jgi:hypothetical protein
MRPTLSHHPKLNRKDAKNAKHREAAEREPIIQRATLGGPSRSSRLCGFAFLLALLGNEPPRRNTSPGPGSPCLKGSPA